MVCAVTLVCAICLLVVATAGYCGARAVTCRPADPCRASTPRRRLPPQTRFTLNGGADWRPLAPPATYRWPVCNTCKAGAPAEQCRLHLHGPTSWFAPQGAPARLPASPCA